MRAQWEGLPSPRFSTMTLSSTPTSHRQATIHRFVAASMFFRKDPIHRESLKTCIAAASNAKPPRTGFTTKNQANVKKTAFKSVVYEPTLSQSSSTPALTYWRTTA